MSTENEQKVNPENSTASVARQGFVVSSMTLISRISGLLRDIAFSYVFGASHLADIFFVAFRVPNFFRRLFAEGAFNQAFIPVLVGFKAKGREELRDFLSSVSGLFGVVLFVFVLAGVVGAEQLVMLFAPGFTSDALKFDQTAELVRIMFPYIGFISLTAYVSGVLNAHDRFAIPAITPVLLNLCLISASLLCIVDFFDGLATVVVLSWSVVMAGIIQLGFQLPSLKGLGLLVKPNLNHRQSGIREIGILIIPAVLSASVGQINALVNTMIASNLVTGSISWLYYADRLLELPVGLVAIALSTVMLPHLSHLSIGGATDDFDRLMNWGVLMGMGLGLPAGIGLYFLSIPLIATLFMSFEGGAMTEHDVEMASQALEMFAIALPGFVLVRVLSAGFFSCKNTQQPFRYASVAVVVNLVGSLLTYKWLGHIGLALSTALSAWTNVFLLYFGLRRHRISFVKLFSPQLFKIYLLTVLIAFVLFLYLPDGEFWLRQSAFSRFIDLTMIIGCVAVAYILLLLLFGFRPRDISPDINEQRTG